MRPFMRAGRLDSAYNAGAASKRNDRCSAAAAPVQHIGDVLFGPWEGYSVGRVGEIAPEDPNAVGQRAPVAVREALVMICRANLVERGRNVDARRPQRDIFSARYRSDLEAGDSEPARQDSVYAGQLFRA